VLRDLKRYHKPIFITENGIANANDDMRKRFIREHIEWALKARAEGIDVRGYFYWSLTDTYEWHDGYGPKFGLVEVDFSSQARRVRPSSSVFKEI
jgi:beta-glucosidase